MIALRTVCARRGADRDRGLTLIELLVTMLLLAVVSTLVVTAVSQAVRILTHTEDEAKGLNDAKVILDRLGRDVRQARSVTCDGGLADPGDLTSADPNCAAHLQLWIDSNSDYAQQPEEIVTWRLRRNIDGEHYDVWRVVGPDSSPVSVQRQASSLIMNIAFAYGGPPAQAEEVRIDMTYDAIRGRGTDERKVAFTARLRNKG